MNDTTDKTATYMYQVATEFRNELIDFIPNLLSALMIMVLGLGAALLFKRLTTLLLNWTSRLFPEKFLIRVGIQQDFESFAVGAGRAVFFVIIFLTITTVLKRMGLEVISSWFEGLAKNLPNFIVAIAVLFLGWKIKNFLADIIERALSKADFSHAKLASHSLAWSVFVISVLVALEQLGINMGLIVSILTVLAGVISGGVALMFALGAKDTISDILYCYQISRFLKVGQRIEVMDFNGVIEAIGPTFILLNTDRGQVNLSGTRFRQELTMIVRGKN